MQKLRIEAAQRCSDNVIMNGSRIGTFRRKNETQLDTARNCDGGNGQRLHLTKWRRMQAPASALTQP
jgi:hypothetical protein